MTDRMSDPSACRAIRELIPWQPTGDLTDQERRLIEDHLALCTACAEAFVFSRDLKQAFDAEVRLHPEPELLVRFAEGSEGLAFDEHSMIEGHLSDCASCREELSILERIDGEQAESFPVGVRIQSIWRSLTKTLLRPIPAAAYLTVAIVAVVLLAVRSGPPPLDKGASSPLGTVIGPVTLLADLTSGVREPDTSAESIPILAKDQPSFLLLELTSMRNPPKPDAVYRVDFSLAGRDEPVWKKGVAGRDFLENYTLCLFIDSREFVPGKYYITVRGPDGEAVFETRIEIR